MPGANVGLHRFAIFVSAATLFLIFVGGLVTSTGSGLAVPDWPLSYGQLFPRMVGGIFYEHGHRMVAASVGLLTIVLAFWLWRRESRTWVRALGVAALVTIIAQGILGGITVLFLLPTPVSVGHAGLAEIFFCLTVCIATFTSPRWQCRHDIEDMGRPSLRFLSGLTTFAIYSQILLGALMRHTESGLAIPDFPLAFGHLVPPRFTPNILVNFSHRIGALLVAFLILWVVARISRTYRSERALFRAALVLLLGLIVQISLGAATVWSGKAPIPTTFHVAGGAFTLATSLFLTLTAHRVTARRSVAGAITMEPATTR